MILANILSREDLQIKDIVEINNYEIEQNINYTGKGMLTVHRKTNISDGDFIVLKQENKILYQGICESVENTDKEDKHIIQTVEIQCLFDRQIILEIKEMISEVGVEDFIQYCIIKNFKSSNDTFLNLTYLNTNALTHTKINTSVDADNNIFNLKTYAGNMLEQHGIFIDFVFKKNELIINIHKKEQSELKIDATVTDINNYEENYKVEALAKLTAIWKKSDDTQMIKNYFLLNDRTITDNMLNENRAKGKIDTIFIEKETEAEMYEEVLNQFRSNSYEHSVEADILKSSKIYPYQELYIGHECLIKTRSRGVQNSIITVIKLKNDSELVFVKFGNMKISLIEKLRGGKIW